MGGGVRHLIMVEVFMETGTTANFIPCRPNRTVKTSLSSEHKHLTNRNKSLKSLSCGTQEEWEVGMKCVHSNI